MNRTAIAALILTLGASPAAHPATILWGFGAVVTSASGTLFADLSPGDAVAGSVGWDTNQVDLLGFDGTGLYESDSDLAMAQGTLDRVPPLGSTTNTYHVIRINRFGAHGLTFIAYVGGQFSTEAEFTITLTAPAASPVFPSDALPDALDLGDFESATLSYQDNLTGSLLQATLTSFAIPEPAITAVAVGMILAVAMARRRAP